MNKPIIEVSGISKTYQGQKSPALKETSFIIYEGDRVGIIGANGSGKTTLFRLIMNFLHPDTGIIRVMGKSNLEKAKRFIGFVPEHQSGLENFTPAELLN
ncbi:MAG: ATP-binding cassette domain-containing protein, partial [Calditrichota bacterium]